MPGMEPHPDLLIGGFTKEYTKIDGWKPPSRVIHL